MDMSWQEITYATCNDHERMLDKIYEIMYKTKRNEDSRWKVCFVSSLFVAIQGFIRLNYVKIHYCPSATLESSLR